MPHPLECLNLTKAFGESAILQQVTLTARSGQIVALLGPSGCGKTTTLRLIAGFDFPDSGTITINGNEVASTAVRVPPEQRRVGMVFQEYALFPHLSIAENIGFGLAKRNSDRAVRIHNLLVLVGLDGLGDRMPYELSGGQQQRIALARALAPHPDILLLDEPFSNLDAALRAQVRSEVRAILKQSGTTCVFVTHDQEEALSLADEVAVMLAGKVVQVADPHKLYCQPVSREVAAFVGEANFLPAEAEGDSAVCVLGRVPLAEPRHGAVDLLIRPEMLTLTPADDGDNARITWREFYGHDQRVGVLLDDGTALVTRLDSDQTYAVGQPVRVSINVPLRAFVRTS